MTKCVHNYIFVALYGNRTHKKGKYSIPLYILPLHVISLKHTLTNLKAEKLEKKLNTMKFRERQEKEGAGRREKEGAGGRKRERGSGKKKERERERED
jgi:hypothetical protein